MKRVPLDNITTLLLALALVTATGCCSTLLTTQKMCASDATATDHSDGVSTNRQYLYKSTIILTTSDSTECTIAVKIVGLADSLSVLPASLAYVSEQITHAHQKHSVAYTSNEIAAETNYAVKVFVDVGKIARANGITITDYIFYLKNK